MHVAAVALSALHLTQAFLTATASSATKFAQFKGWKTYKANGVNLGAWLELEKSYAGGVIPDAYVDEWTYCEAVGKAVCSVVLEEHYATYVTTADIDKLARYGVNTVRIATTYAVWVDFADSWLYHGSQLDYLRTVAEYAITRYNMHVIVGTNGLEIGEATGHMSWWNNATHFAESMQVVGKVLDYIEASLNSASYTFSPINEPGDSFSTLFTSDMVSYPKGTDWLLKYMRAVYAMIKSRQMSTPLLHTDTYHDDGPSYWASYWPTGSNIVMDTHICEEQKSDYFEPAGISAAELPLLACAKAKYNSTSTFPVFVGEFTVAATDNNTLAFRPETQLYAFQKYLNGGSYWNVRYLSNDTIGSGEGLMSDYWSYESLIDAGAINPGGALTNIVQGC
ncbi:hypothetical protein RQP46_007113 [Phenoliferia psychrophenolica]